MTDQLPTPAIELLLLQLFLGSATFLVLALFLVWLMIKRNLFDWKSYLLIILLAFLTGNVGAMMIWARWPFSFDVMFGLIYWPGLVAYGSIMCAGYYFTSRSEK